MQEKRAKLSGDNPGNGSKETRIDWHHSKRREVDERMKQKSLGMRQGETCNFMGCSGKLKFRAIEYHELDKKKIEKCDLCECDICGVQALVRSSES